MTRSLYRLVLLLHPGEFRRHFVSEMLWIFDESASSGGALPLFWRCVSFACPAMDRPAGTWKVAVATIGGFLYIGFVMKRANPRGCARRRRRALIGPVHGRHR